MKKSDMVIPQGKLGRDLPDSEEDLFNIKYYPLFDREFAEDVIGNEANVKAIFISFFDDNEKDLNAIKVGFDCGDLEEVQRLAHKLKSSALYGTIRLHFSLLFLERYLQAGHTSCYKKLYTQMLETMNLTLRELETAGLMEKIKN